MNKLEEPRVIFAESLNEDDLAEENQEDNYGDEDIADDIPVMKKRKLDSELQQIVDAERQVMLTKHFKLESELGPAYTGGKFTSVKDGFAFAQNNSQISLIVLSTGKVAGKVV